MCHAGWPSGTWPSETYPREGYGQLSSVWSATVERCSAAGVTLPATTNLHRPGTSFSTDLKGCLKTAIPFYVNTNGITSYTNYFWTANPDARSLPLWTATGVLIACKMPANWFDYTPPRGLSGLGGSTNDASVGHPYGFTNAWTILGGTNYPSGRSKWYTTDYGYGRATGIFARLLSIGVTPTVSNIWAGTSKTVTDPNYLWANHTEVAASPGGVHDYFTAVSSNVGAQARGYGCYYKEHFSDVGGGWWVTDRNGAEFASKWLLSCTNRYTNVSCTARYFMNIVPTGYNPYDKPTSFPNMDLYFTNVTSSFNVDAPISGWPERSLSLLATISYNKGSNVLTSGWFGSTNSYIAEHGFAPAFGWAPYPFTGSQIPGHYSHSTKGWQWYDTDYVVLTYDFVYK